MTDHDPWGEDDEPAGLRGFVIGAAISVAFWLTVAIAVARCAR